MFAKHYTDYEHLITTYLPILIEHKFDMYLNGHEHCLEHATYPLEEGVYDIHSTGHSSSFYGLPQKFNLIEANFKKFTKDLYKFFTKKSGLLDDQCVKNVEKNWAGTKVFEARQGEMLH